MKRILAFVLSACMVASFTGCSNSEPAPAGFTAGKYTGTGMGNNGPISVEVTMNESGIESIEVTETSETKGIGTVAVDQISEEMIVRQSLDVDSIAGATLTSAAFKTAVKEAVAQAGDVSALRNDAKVAPEQYSDSEVELVIIGAGGAGISAAVEANKAGINTVLLEKEGILGGTTTVVGVGLNAGGTKLQQETTVDDYYQHLVENGATKTYVEQSEDYCHAFADNAKDALNWLIDLGVDFKVIEGTNNVGSHQLVSQENGKLGEVMIELMVGELEKCENVDVRVNNEATKILMSDGKVQGVEVSGKNGSYTIKTENVIIATGGYASSDEIIKEYAPQYINYNSTMCISSDGSGIKLGLEAGGTVTDMTKMTIRQLSVGYPGVGGGTHAHNTLSSGEILVDKDGNRFVNELAAKGDLLSAYDTLEKNTCYIIATQEMVDGNAELAGRVKRGLTKTADSVEELAAALGISAEGLKATVEAYDAQVADNAEDPFGRAEYKGSFAEGPFYGVEARPSRHYCNGGLITNGKAEMLDADMNVIPGLYAAGEVTWHSEHPASNAVTFGMVAAKTVAEKLGK